MKKFNILYLLTICLGFALNAAYSQTQESIEIALTDPGQRGKLSVDVRYGPVTITGSSRSDVVVKYTALSQENKEKEKTKNGLKKIGHATLSLEVAERDNHVYVESESLHRGVKVEIEIPSGFDVSVDAYNQGKVHISNIEGEVEVETYNGGITIENVTGSVVADTYNGPIKVTFEAVTNDKAMAFSTYNGDVDISLPSSFKGDFKMKTERGEIYTDFEMSMSKGEPKTISEKRSGVTKVYIDDWVRGKTNGGGSEITMENYNGDLYVRKKA